MPGTRNTPASLRVKVRPELPGNFPLCENLSHKFRPFPLDPLRRGGAARASRAKARRARRENGACARAAFARVKNSEKAEGLSIRLFGCSREEGALSFGLIEMFRGVKE